MSFLMKPNYRGALVLLFLLASGVEYSWARDFEYRGKFENVVSLGEKWKGTLSLESRHDSDGDQTR